MTESIHHAKIKKLDPHIATYLIELNLEILTDNFLKLLPVDFNKDPEYKRRLSATLKNWTKDTVKIFEQPSFQIELVEQLHALERMNIMVLKLLKKPTETEVLIDKLNTIMKPEEHLNEIKEVNETKKALILMSTFAMIAQKLEEDVSLSNPAFTQLHLILSMKLNGTYTNQSFDASISDELIKKYTPYLNQIEFEIYSALEGNFSLTNDLSEFLQENETSIDPAQEKIYLATFASANKAYMEEKKIERPPSPTYALSPSLSVSSGLSTAASGSDDDSIGSPRKSPRKSLR